MYQLEIELEPTNIDNEKLYKATESSNGNNKSKYIDKNKLSHIMKVLHPNSKDLNFVRKATQLFRAEKITIEK